MTAAPRRHTIVTHYHADHVYGPQVYEDAGATNVAHRSAHEYLNSEAAQQRLHYSRDTMAPAIDATTRLVPPRQAARRGPYRPAPPHYNAGPAARPSAAPRAATPAP